VRRLRFRFRTRAPTSPVELLDVEQIHVERPRQETVRASTERLWTGLDLDRVRPIGPAEQSRQRGSVPDAELDQSFKSRRGGGPEGDPRPGRGGGVIGDATS
jgi:hypothetical protein